MAQLNMKAFWHYYRTVTFINVVFSGLVALMRQNIFWLPAMFSTFGIGIGILVFNYYYKHQYYFYYNMGYTRKKLALNTFLVNLPVLGILLVLIALA